jgi:hypothetical protein
MHDVWQYGLFEALYGRRSRRFGLGFEITEGPFQYKSHERPVPMSELEEAFLIAAGGGISGTPLWDMGRPVARGVGDGRTHGSTTAGGRRTALLFTNDDGVYVMDVEAAAAAKVKEVETADEREKILDLYRLHRRKLRDGRLEIPRRIPPMFAHDFWDSNRPGSTLFMPVCDVSETLINMISQLVDAEAGRFVKGQGGGMYIVDDRHGFRPAGTEPWAKRGFLDTKKVLPLSILERQACYFMFAEPALVCQNIFLATEALGVGGWMYCGFLSLQVLEALGFRTVTSSTPPSLVNPVGLDGVLEGRCPPYFADMSAAVDAVASRRRPSLADPLRLKRPAPYSMSDADYHNHLVELSDEGLACTKAICKYVYETYGRFPGTVDTMHLMWFMQVHHLDLNFYDRFFRPGAYGPTHLAHMSRWHSS